MDENKELLTHIYNDSDMAISSLTVLLNKIVDKDNKIKKVTEDILKGYEEYLKKIKKYIKKYKVEIKGNNMMSKMGAKTGISKIVDNDNSDARIADMLIQGFTLGVLSISKRIDNYEKEADKSIISLSKDFKKFQQNNIELLKKYL